MFLPDISFKPKKKLLISFFRLFLALICSETIERVTMRQKLLLEMTNIISKSFPRHQAEAEAMWISQELEQDKWLNASIDRSHLVPLQYILGTQPFGILNLKCREGVLIPRMDTEEWVMETSKVLESVKISNILDYCTGSGCVGLGLASELKSFERVDCIDFKETACRLASENMEINKNSLNGHLKIHRGDIFDSFLPFGVDYKKKTDNNLLVSNPPYVTNEEFQNGTVEKSVLKYEPHEALSGDLEFYQALCANIINPNASFKAFIFELGNHRQAQTVRSMLRKDQWTVGIRNDHSGNLRNVLGWKTTSQFDVMGEMVHKYL